MWIFAHNYIFLHTHINTCYTKFLGRVRKAANKKKKEKIKMEKHDREYKQKLQSDKVYRRGKSV